MGYEHIEHTLEGAHMKRPPETNATRYVVVCDARPSATRGGSYSVWDTFHEYTEARQLSKRDAQQMVVELHRHACADYGVPALR